MGKAELENLTVALNLALALHKLGYSTSLFDADIYGPSIPMMTGTRNIRLTTSQEKLLPLEKFGIEFVSIGHLVKEGDSIVWRGPMVSNSSDAQSTLVFFSGIHFRWIIMGFVGLIFSIPAIWIYILKDYQKK